MSIRSPKEAFIAIEAAGVPKLDQRLLNLVILSVFAGAYIAFGGVFAGIIASGMSDIGKSNPGVPKLAFSATFPVGLMMVVFTGAELFTGNNMVALLPWISGKRPAKRVVRNFVVSYFGNLAGSLLVSYFLVHLAGYTDDPHYSSYMSSVAEKKTSLGWGSVMLRGIGANWLVNLAVYLAVASTDAIGKIFGIFFPIAAFVGVGFEHSIANMSLIPIGMLSGGNVSVGEFVWKNLIPVTLGNMIGGGVFVGVLHYFVYQEEFSSKSRSSVQQSPLPSYDEEKGCSQVEVAVANENGEDPDL